ncbi:MAG: OsmC family protein [Anaerolineae bacterium]
MGERVVVRQDRHFVTCVLAADPHEPESEELQEVNHIHELTPYGMMMVSLASCTGIVLHTYAQHHGIDLEEVSFDVRYDRFFAEDCAECEDIESYADHIEEAISLSGSLADGDRDRLYAVSHQCPIHTILMDGMEVHSYLTED